MTARVPRVGDVAANVNLCSKRGLSAEYFDVITAMSGREVAVGKCDVRCSTR